MSPSDPRVDGMLGKILGGTRVLDEARSLMKRFTSEEEDEPLEEIGPPPEPLEEIGPSTARFVISLFPNAFLCLLFFHSMSFILHVSLNLDLTEEQASRDHQDVSSTSESSTLANNPEMFAEKKLDQWQRAVKAFGQDSFYAQLCRSEYMEAMQAAMTQAEIKANKAIASVTWSNQSSAVT